MAEIKLLDQQTIDQIAAGEVIERPASVVKELVENSIDAGATAVTVEIRDGGISLIRVTDNGNGIDRNQVSVAFLRHSTSKIRRAEDLMGVSSLGFRGEALSSIASIAMVELVTKTKDADAGVRYVIEGGAEKKIEDTAAPEGTTFLVRNLFYNTPARRKFLKSPVTEAGYISELMERLALSRPDISFQFLNNGQVKEWLRLSFWISKPSIRSRQGRSLSGLPLSSRSWWKIRSMPERRLSRWKSGTAVSPLFG